MNFKLIVINGHMGAGKSTLTRSLIENLPGKTFHLEIDKIKGMFGKYKEDKSKNLQIAYDISGGIIDKSLKNGVTVIVDKAMGVNEIKVYEDIAADYNVETVKIFLHLDLPVQIRRINNRNVEKGEAILSKEEANKFKEKFKPFIESSSLGFKVIDTNNLTPEEVLREAIKIIGL